MISISSAPLRMEMYLLSRNLWSDTTVNSSE